MSSEDDISPLLAMRQKLDNQIAAILEKVAGIRKKRDVLQNAIDVLRSGDEELAGYSSATPKQARVYKNYSYDSAVVETLLLNLLGEKGPMKFKDIHPAIVERGQDISSHGLRAILNTCPHITVEGQRDQTRYRSL